MPNYADYSHLHLTDWGKRRLLELGDSTSLESQVLRTLDSHPTGFDDLKMYYLRMDPESDVVSVMIQFIKIGYVYAIGLPGLPDTIRTLKIAGITPRDGVWKLGTSESSPVLKTKYEVTQVHKVSGRSNLSIIMGKLRTKK